MVISIVVCLPFLERGKVTILYHMSFSDFAPAKSDLRVCQSRFPGKGKPNGRKERRQGDVSHRLLPQCPACEQKKQPSASVATGNHKTDLTPSDPHFSDKRAKWYYFHL